MGRRITFPLGSAPLPDRQTAESPRRGRKENPMHLSIEFRKPIALSTIIPLLACILFPQMVPAVMPPPDGGYGPPTYGTGNTAEGEDALLSLTGSGHFNT